MTGGIREPKKREFHAVSLNFNQQLVMVISGSRGVLSVKWNRLNGFLEELTGGTEQLG